MMSGIIQVTHASTFESFNMYEELPKVASFLLDK